MRRGRPAVIEGSRILRAQLSDRQWAVLALLAERQGVSVAHVVRQLIDLAGLEFANVDG